MVEAAITPLNTLTGHENAVSALCITGGRLYSASKDSTIKEWDVETGECLRTFVGHVRWVRAICAGNGRIFSGSWDDTVREWDLETGECVRVFEGAHELGINAVVVDEENSRLYSGSDDRTIAVYDLQTGETIDSWAGFGSGSISSLCIIKLPNQQAGASDCLVSGASDGSVCLWDLSTGHCLENSAASTHEVTSVVVIGGGSRLYTAGNDKVIHEWDLSNWVESRSFRGHSGYVSSLAVTVGTGLPPQQSVDAPSDDSDGVAAASLEPAGGPRVFSGSWDGTVRIWDLITGGTLAVIRASEKSINAIAIGEQGRLFTGSGDGTIKSWDLNSLPVEALGTMGVPIPSVEQSMYYQPPPAQQYAHQSQSYSRGPSYTNSGPGSRNGGPEVCRFYQRGQCKFGESCRYLHVDGSGGFGGPGPAEGGDGYY